MSMETAIVVTQMVRIAASIRLMRYLVIRRFPLPLFSDGHCGGAPGITGRPTASRLELDVVEQWPVERADLEAGRFVRDRVYPQPAGGIDRDVHRLGQQHLEYLMDFFAPSL